MDAFEWHENPRGGLCETCGAKARKGTKHRALRAHELGKFGNAFYVKKVRVAFGQDVDVRPL